MRRLGVVTKIYESILIYNTSKWFFMVLEVNIYLF